MKSKIEYSNTPYKGAVLTPERVEIRHLREVGLNEGQLTFRTALMAKKLYPALNQWTGQQLTELRSALLNGDQSQITKILDKWKKQNDDYQDDDTKYLSQKNLLASENART